MKKDLRTQMDNELRDKVLALYPIDPACDRHKDIEGGVEDCAQCSLRRRANAEVEVIRAERDAELKGESA